LAADTSDGPTHSAWDDALNVWHQRNQIGQAIADGMNKNARPASIVNCLDLNRGKMAGEARIDAFVEQDLHAAS
jgi:hypothetical protein